MADNPRLPKDSGKIDTAPKVTSYMTKGDPGKGVGDDDPKRKPLGFDDKPDKKPDEDDDQKLLGRMRKRFDRCISAEADNRKEASAALKFKNGEQWPADILAQRNIDRRPAETVNYMRTVINQVTNAQRENRPSINVSPVGERADKDVAKMYRGLIRAIERESRADIAYDTAFDGAASIGVGYFRVLVGPAGPDSFNDKITIPRIRNPFTVYLDPDHQEPDGADCRYAFITEIIPEDEFEEEYPDAKPLSFDMAGQGDKFKEWKTGDGIRIVEYFEITHDDKVLVELKNGWVGYKDEMKGPGDIKRTRDVKVPIVKWYKCSAIEVLERTDWLGHSIPIYPVIGNEVDIEGSVKLSGLIKDAMGPQRSLNVLRTYTLEHALGSVNSPFMVEEGQIEGHEDEWANANTKPVPYLSYKGTTVNGTAAPPPQKIAKAEIPAALVQAAQDAANDLMATTGIKLKVTQQGPEADHRESGRMIREQRRDSDIGSYHFGDNFARTLKRLGDDLIDLIPKVYTEAQMVTILREDDVDETVKIDPSHPQAYEEKQGKDGKLTKIFNPTIGKYGVTVDIGPSYATKRIEASESMMDFVKALPNTAQLVSDLIAAEMDWPGADKIAARLAKAIPPNLLTPDQKDMSPQVQALIQSLEQNVKMLTQQLQAAMKEIEEKGADRAIAKEKIHSDFSAKILSIVQKAESDGGKLDLEKIRMIMEHARHESDAERESEQAKTQPEKKSNA